MYKLLGSIAAAGSGLLLYSGAFSNIEIEDKTMENKLFVYKKNTGDYSMLKFIKMQVAMDMKEISKDYSFAKLSGDSPSALDHNQSNRPIFGAMISPDKKDKVEQFLHKHPAYSMIELNDMNAISARFPYRGGLGENMMKRRGIFSKLAARAEKNEYGQSFLEIYPSAKGEKVIEVLAPYGENAELISFGHLNVMKH